MGRTRLVRRSAAGDPLFDDFVRAHAPILLRTAVLITGDRGHAEDLVQTTLLRTASRWSVAAASPKAYAFRVLINLGRDRARRLRRRIPEDLSGTMEMPFLSPASVDETATVLDRQLLTSRARRTYRYSTRGGRVAVLGGPLGRRDRDRPSHQRRHGEIDHCQGDGPIETPACR